MRIRPLKIFVLAFATAAALALSSCSETSNVPDPTEHDVITTVALTFTDDAGGNLGTFVWEDADGVGGAAPNRIDTIKLNGVNFVNVSIGLLNATVSPADTLTKTVVDEGTQHQFFITASTASTIISTVDQDANGRPIGQKFTMEFTDGVNGTLTIELCHYKDAADKDGVNKSDETDVSVTFPIVVQ